MQHEIVIAGFGGQGVLTAGQILAYAAMEEGFNVVWMPSYGPEMRGGTANCSVLISDKPIASPMVPNPAIAVVMNNPSLEKFGPALKPGGLLIINSSLVNIECDRTDIHQIKVPCNQIAIEAGNARIANMVVLGTLVAATKCVDFEELKKAVSKKFGSKPALVEMNVRGMEVGYKVAEDNMKGRA